ncbi:putative phosphoadenosine phosphosulfate reductase [Escherichia coli]|nr:putative phosphoadenosine phosphosulfate reductase [Escherichia coli]
MSAAIHRIEWLFETFSSVCLSFSGGKDSTVLFHLVAEVAYRKKRRFSVLFIDWEAQYQCTIDHIQKMRMMYQDVTDTFYWVALPLTTVNGVSQFQPEWICWEPGVEWVRLNRPGKSWRLNSLEKEVNRMTKNTRFSPEVRQRGDSYGSGKSG